MPTPRSVFSNLPKGIPRPGIPARVPQAATGGVFPKRRGSTKSWRQSKIAFRSGFFEANGNRDSAKNEMRTASMGHNNARRPRAAR